MGEKALLIGPAPAQMVPGSALLGVHCSVMVQVVPALTAITCGPELRWGSRSRQTHHSLSRRQPHCKCHQKRRPPGPGCSQLVRCHGAPFLRLDAVGPNATPRRIVSALAEGRFLCCNTTPPCDICPSNRRRRSRRHGRAEWPVCPAVEGIVRPRSRMSCAELGFFVSCLSK
jgi:hypothetical protein